MHGQQSIKKHLLLCEVIVLNWLSVPSQSAVKSRKFIGFYFMKFAILHTH